MYIYIYMYVYMYTYIYIYIYISLWYPHADSFILYFICFHGETIRPPWWHPPCPTGPASVEKVVKPRTVDDQWGFNQQIEISYHFMAWLMDDSWITHNIYIYVYIYIHIYIYNVRLSNLCLIDDYWMFNGWFMDFRMDNSCISMYTVCIVGNTYTSPAIKHQRNREFVGNENTYILYLGPCNRGGVWWRMGLMW